MPSLDLALLAQPGLFSFAAAALLVAGLLLAPPALYLAFSRE